MIDVSMIYGALKAVIRLLKSKGKERQNDKK